MPDPTSIIAALADSGLDVDTAAHPRPVSGGDISAAWRVEMRDGEAAFLKTGPASSYEMFSAEAAGLSELAAPRALQVPRILACGLEGDTAFVALEWLTLGRPGRDTERLLGERLAALHRTTNDRYGWHRDNTIGLTPQLNPWSDDWVDFVREQRIGFQLRLAADKGFTGELQAQGARLLQRLPKHFANYEPEASLLHGDLWGGNWGSCEGEPVIFDPAVYYGDRESDLAMTRLFGGFGRAFYDAYETAWPLAPGHRQRSDIYQLYHVLNHLNLFGGGYLGRAQALINRLV
ncbi:MAG: fructosamine kinase family protein [Gammaproteobacteria bacterium]|nr:fructosamine kinase family protein [Gammaproteobacteria bacterium]